MFVSESSISDTLVLGQHLMVCVCVLCGFVLFVYLETKVVFSRPPTEAISQAFAAYSRLA